MQATAVQDVLILLEPVSHPELGDIPIEEDLFAIGRNEAPFAAYPPAVVDALSRRHARIFCERGLVYVADLGSKNGTMVNGVPVRDRPARLKEGDEIRFGGELAYRVHLAPRREKAAPEARLLGVTLAPERDDLGLEPIVITQFPFLVSKGEEHFARYKERYPHQVNYLSRRHAHIFLKGGQPWLEDLGSTNGSFVAGQRLDEHAVQLQEGDLVAFGGQHFVYRVRLQKEKALDPTVTKLAFAPEAGPQAGDAEKTTFVAAADSFLNIFCVEPAQPAEEEAAADGDGSAQDGRKEGGRKRGRLAILVSELAQAFAGDESAGLRRYLWWGAGAFGLLLAVALTAYFRGASEREVKKLIAGGEYARAAIAADQNLERSPDNAELKALGTEATLKAHVPPWVAQMKARDFDAAAATVAGMKPFAVHNPDVESLVRKLEWMGDLERFFVGRGGPEAPIRVYADEERIRKLLQPWDEDAQGYQRAFDRISSYVPEFADFYAEALSHLRKIQSDDSVYVAAIERLKGTIATELERDRPEALEAVLDEYAEKYPRLGGLDAVRADLRRYREILDEIQARRPDRVAALLSGGGFATPSFQARLRELANKGRLPAADVLKQYEAISQAWKNGEIEQALAGLQQMSSGPWADTASRELARRKNIAEQFAELQNARGAKGYDDRLLAFYGALDPDEDVHFIKAISGDLAANRDKALKHAQEALGRAQALWARYRENGAIAEAERAEGSISARFRSQARLLADAQLSARQGQRIYTLLKADVPAQWAEVEGEIDGEMEQQRRSLLELRESLDSGVLKSKLALLGEHSGEQGQSP